MAKATGPFLSQEAHGSIAKFLTFSKRHTRQFVRFQNKQKDKMTPDRTAQRQKFSLGLDLWRSLPDNEKNYWDILLKTGEVSIP